MRNQGRIAIKFNQPSGVAVDDANFALPSSRATMASSIVSADEGWECKDGIVSILLAGLADDLPFDPAIGASEAMIMRESDVKS